MANIYEISPWANGTDYSINDIVYYDLNGKKYYWYARVAITAASTAPSLSNSQWGGVKYDDKTGTVKTHFFWKHSYGLNITNEPRVQSLKFGDGYEQRNIDGINSLLLRGDTSFDLRDMIETKAIAHFFNSRRGAESFIMRLPPPYDIDKLFVAKSWNVSLVFYNNYSIRTQLEEVSK